MANLAFLGGLIGAAAVIGWVVWAVRRKIRRFSQDVFGQADILEALSGLDTIAEESPRSLSGCDRLLMPQILKDFPDFDPELAKTYARDYLEREVGSHPDFSIYNVVMAKYLPSAVQKTIVFQAALSWMENGKRTQKRYDLNYTYLLGGGQTGIAANCPNCGGALGFGQRECPYCGSRVANALGSSWRFTELTET